ENELSARETVIKDTIRKLDALFQRADSLLSEIEEQRKADAEPLPLPPTEEPEELPKDPPRTDEGDLEILKPKGEEPADDELGDLPSEFAFPAGSANYPTLEDPESPQVPQPVSVSLNKDD